MSQGHRRKTGAKKEPEGKEDGPRRPSGLAPLASVTSRHARGTVNRLARGFSSSELEAGGVSRTFAERWDLQVDIRRRSTVEANVEALRKWRGSATEKEGEVRKVEGEVSKVGREVKAEVKKEISRVKKEVKKAEKEAAEVIEKPVKARQRKKKPAK